MRLEATLPDSRGDAAVKLADELGLTRSQLVDEALALFMKVVLEVRRGRRLATIDPFQGQLTCELSSPTLTALEWASRPAPQPTEALKRAARNYRKALARRAAAARSPKR